MKKVVFVYLLLLSVLFPYSCLGEEIVYTSTQIVDSSKSLRPYMDFDESGDLSVLVPGLKEGFIPQGISYIPNEDAFLFSGYNCNGDNSVLFEVDRCTGVIIRQIKLQNPDGSDYTGHSGGVCVTEKDIYISDDPNHQLLRISLDTFVKLPSQSYCKIEDKIPVPVLSNYCNYSEGILWVGEFETKGSTDESHWIVTADGLQRAWTCGYIMTEEQDFTSPDYILSMTYRIQGMTVMNGKIFLSQSFHRENDSMIYRYPNVLCNQPDKMVIINGQKVPLWILDQSNLEKALLSPPMTEGLCTVEGGIYVVFESAGEKYMDPSNPSRNPFDRVYRLTSD